MKKSVVSWIAAAAAVLVFVAVPLRPGAAGSGNPGSAAVSPDGKIALPNPDSGLRFVPGRVLLRFKKGIPSWMSELWIASYNAREIGRLHQIRTHILELSEGVSVEEAVAALNRHPEVDFAEPDYIASANVTPNDTFFGYQYALYNSGQPISIPGSPTGKPSADIKATAAWEETRGDSEVVVAVVDTGADLLHPDLENKFAGSGRDFINEDFDASDDHGHGTWISGIIGAETDNNLGVAGAAWNCRLLPVKVLDENAEGAYSTIAEGILWAVDNGADIINLSLGYSEDSLALSDAVAYAYEQGAVLCAGTGNTGSAVEYPAAYDDYCLAAAATDYNDARPPWSNFGPEVDVAAPGASIFSTFPRGHFGPGSLDYGFSDGTSAAAAHVSALAALIISVKPLLTPAEVMDIIRFSCDDVNEETDPEWDEFLGYGRLNMEKALVPIVIKNRSGE
ncbi:MAG: S8 family serine peptidase [Candidatus Aminicenantes bacterium]|nr:S8 family serine peptidase [Candidatus Aminicenantes bacterium]